MNVVQHKFTTDIPHWHPYITPVDLAAASAEQLDALKITPSNTKVSDYVLVLAHDPESLAHRTPLFNAIMYGKDGLSRAERELGAVGASIVNHCVYCTAVHASRFNALTKRTDVIEAIFANGVSAELEEHSQVVFDFSVKLSQCPSEAGPREIKALKAVGLSDLEIVDLILSAAIFGWANRLMHTLGEPLAKLG